MDATKNPNLDTHLLLRLIDCTERQGSLTNELRFLRIAALAKTRRFAELQDQVVRIKEIGFPTLQGKLKEAEATTASQLASLEAGKPLDQLLDLPDDEEEFSKETLELFQRAYELSRIYYEQGRYEQALELLVQLDYFVDEFPLWLPTSWGKLNTEILLNRWEKARESAKRLKYKIDTYRFPNVQRALAQKESFLNTCCFVFFELGQERDMETFIDICTEEEYFSTIQMVCPYLLRYLTVAMLLNKTYQRYGQFDLYRLVDSINRNLFKYNDAVVEFIRLLLIRFDFDSAGRQLAELRREVESDPFLVKLAPKIIESSRGLYYESYCRIHETLQIANVAAFTGKDPEEAEMWIVSLIRRSGISVRVDSVAGTIKIVRNLGRNSNEVKYAELIPRTNTLVNNLSRILLQG